MLRHNIILKILLVFLVIGCDENTKKEFFPSPAQKANSITYVKDERTQLCFVYNYVTNSSMGSYDIFTNVPCSPEVEKLLVK
jgi:hypothetical protein